MKLSLRRILLEGDDDVRARLAKLDAMRKAQGLKPGDAHHFEDGDFNPQQLQSNPSQDHGYGTKGLGLIAQRLGQNPSGEVLKVASEAILSLRGNQRVVQNYGLKGPNLIAQALLSNPTPEIIQVAVELLSTAE